MSLLDEQSETRRGGVSWFSIYVESERFDKSSTCRLIIISRSERFGLFNLSIDFRSISSIFHFTTSVILNYITRTIFQ